MKDINLFRVYQKEPRERRKLLKKIRVGVILSLLVYCLVTASIFSYWLVLRKSSQSLFEKVAGQKEHLAELEPVENLHVFLKQRLSALIPYFDQKRIDYEAILNRLEESRPDAVFFSKIEVEINGGLAVAGEAPSAIVLSELLDNLLILQEEGIFNRLNVDSLSRRDDGSYSFDLKIDAQV